MPKRKPSRLGREGFYTCGCQEHGRDIRSVYKNFDMGLQCPRCLVRQNPKAATNSSRNQNSNCELSALEIAPGRTSTVFKCTPSAAVRWLSALPLSVMTVVVPTTGQARLEGPPRADFIKGNFQKCVEASKRNAVARTLPANIVTRLCTCASNYTADRLTLEDLAIGTYGNRAELAQIDRKSSAIQRAGIQTCKERYRNS